MNKSELVAAVAAEAGLTKAQAQKAVEATVNAVAGALKNGEKVQLVGFGTFKTKKLAARSGRNPATGDKIKIALDASRIHLFDKDTERTICN